MDIAVSIISAIIIGKMLWGWWMNAVFKRFGLETDPRTKQPIPYDETSRLVVEILGGMQFWYWAVVTPVAFLMGVDASGTLVAVASGAIIAAWIFALAWACFARAESNNKKMFTLLVKLFTRHKTRMQK